MLAAWMLGASSATSGDTSSRRIISLRPMMVLMGVRISWLMLEKKRFWASFRAWISWRCRSARLFSRWYRRISKPTITLTARLMNTRAA